MNACKGFEPRNIEIQDYTMKRKAEIDSLISAGIDRRFPRFEKECLSNFLFRS